MEHSLSPPKSPRPPRPFFHAVTGVKKPANPAAGRVPLKTIKVIVEFNTLNKINTLTKCFICVQIININEYFTARPRR